MRQQTINDIMTEQRMTILKLEKQVKSQKTEISNLQEQIRLLTLEKEYDC